MDIDDLVARLATAPGDAALAELLAEDQARRRLDRVTALVRRHSAAQAEALGRAWAAAPDALRRLLLDPGVVDAARRDPGAVVAAAAIHAGVRAVVTVCPHDHAVLLPGLGIVRIPLSGNHSRPEPVALEVTGRRLTITVGGETIGIAADPGTAGPHWEPLPRITTGRIATLDVILAPGSCESPGAPGDFIDIPVADRRRALVEGWRLLERELPEQARAIAAGLRVVVPVPAAARRAERGTDGTFGAIRLPYTPIAEAVAATLIAEFRHGEFAAAADLVPMYRTGYGDVAYAPWRADPRPLHALLPGVYAQLGVARFWERRRAGNRENALHADVRFARRRADARRACLGILGAPGLTPAGGTFVALLAAELDRLCEAEVHPEASAAAARFALDDAISWRLRNFSIDAAAAGRLATAWLERRPPVLPELDTIRIRLPQPVLGSRIRTRLTYRELSGGTRDNSGPPADTPPPEAVPRADLLYARGDYRPAVDAYCARLRRDPDDIDAWAGLALSLPADAPARAALVGAADLVAEIYRRVAASLPPEDRSAPLRLARWIAAGRRAVRRR
ncbi:aKG-HExxH-type peptide beta-hydroxylase [Nocardia sp. alder85J]|uniref:aKG-HExxH-type peptide beta-hydroxylase n=1 Tax=Nocardia sp. alder85J TaxID=2862949 RepID=UPI001CD54F95|nr:HEXXH motif-containing putative peptide modification protein [Nocardia sp. alder85J]MCX4092189.1 HEXXH motif-containing putative peptide modification protein [Nocardia sp. alder85J]